MYSLQLLKKPKECAAGCGRLVTSRFAGHLFREPMCHSCFEQAAPEVAEAFGLWPTSIQLLKSRLDVTCANCGDDLSGRRLVGYHLGDPLCIGCFRQHSKVLATLLLLEKAALMAAAGSRDVAGLLKVALSYARNLYRLDAEHPRERVKPKKRSS